uniref:Uncharacterized protein LOC105631523 n=1 Tax=Rhizophora mucronata TaxID=61149 RepID=A0A2P2PPB4_RHIMU
MNPHYHFQNSISPSRYSHCNLYVPSPLYHHNPFPSTNSNGFSLLRSKFPSLHYYKSSVPPNPHFPSTKSNGVCLFHSKFPSLHSHKSSVPPNSRFR